MKHSCVLFLFGPLSRRSGDDVGRIEATELQKTHEGAEIGSKQR